MGMNEKLTIFDTIDRVERKFSVNPNMTLISASEAGDIAEEAGVAPVKLDQRERTRVHWYKVSDIKEAIARFRSRQEEIRAIKGLGPIHGKPAHYEPNLAQEDEVVSLQEAGVYDNPIKVPEPETAQTTMEAPPLEPDTDGEQATDGPSGGGDSLTQAGLSGTTASALVANGIGSIAALHTLIEAQGVAGLKGLDGIGAGRIKEIEKALELTNA